MDVQPLGLITGEAVGDRLEGGADGVEIVEPLPEAEVIKIVGAKLVAQESRELLILLEEGALKVGAEDMMAVFDLIDDRRELAAHAAIALDPRAEDQSDLVGARSEERRVGKECR